MAIRHQWHSRTYIVFAVGMIAGFSLSLVLRLFSGDVGDHVMSYDDTR